MFKIKLVALEADAWQLLERLAGRTRGRIVFCRATIDRLTTIKGDLKMLILTDTQECDLAIKPVDKKGNAAQVDGIPVWTTSDATIASVTPAADGLSAVVKAADNLGSVQVGVTADADLGEGVEPIGGVLDVEIAAGKAVSVTVIAGTPREQI